MENMTITGEKEIEALRLDTSVIPQFTGPYHDRVNTDWWHARGWNACLDHLARTNRLAPQAREDGPVTDDFAIVRNYVRPEYSSNADEAWDALNRIESALQSPKPVDGDLLRDMAQALRSHTTDDFGDRPAEVDEVLARYEMRGKK